MTGGAAISLAIALCAASSCSDPPAPPAGPTCNSFDYSTYAPGPTKESFRTDVIPIFGRACAFSICHGSDQNPMGNLYLGPNINNVQGNAASTPPFYPPDDATLATIHGGLVGANGKLPVTMLLVQAGNPKGSFLMHKIEGDQSCADIACNAIDTGKCGEAMPQRTTPLEAGAIMAIRDWIAQGASND
jgi:hypothetical protein